MSTLFSFSYGVTFFAGFVFFAATALIADRNFFRSSLIPIAVGGTVSSLIFLWAVGYNELIAAGEIMLRLVKFGKLVQLSQEIGNRFLFACAMQAIHIVFAFHWINSGNFHRNRKTYLISTGLIWIFWFHLDYGMHDLFHFHSITWTVSLLLLLWVKNLYFTFVASKPGEPKYAMILAAIASATMISGVHPGEALEKLSVYLESRKASDASLIQPEFQQVKVALAERLKTAPCIFVTDGIYLVLYYVLGKPSCSYFYSADHATDFGGASRLQRELMSDPGAILISTNKRYPKRKSMGDAMENFSQFGRSGDFLFYERKIIGAPAKKYLKLSTPGI